MSGLKVLGIDLISRQAILESLLTLLLFSMATSSLFEICKMIPSFLQAQSNPPGRIILYLYLFWIIVFCPWGIHIYRKYKRAVASTSYSKTSSEVLPHKGIVTALSKPSKQTPEEINTVIGQQKDKEGLLKKLFGLWSIGQLFKGLWYHRETLTHIWLIKTGQSAPYEACFRRFVTQFIPKAKIVGEEGLAHPLTLLDTSDQELISEVKEVLGCILTDDYLENYGLSRSDVIVDISGGPKPMTIGMIFGAMGASTDFQYVEQKNQTVIPLSLSPDIILDKTAEYLADLYRYQSAKQKVGV